jgi:hypothetical protein
MAKINKRTNEQWRKLIADCEAGSLTQEQWCAEHNISLYTLRDRAMRLRRLDERAGQMIAEKQGFVEVVTTVEKPIGVSGQLVIEAGERRLAAYAGYPANTLAALIKELTR